MISRYTLPKMGKIWEEEYKFKKMLEIEIFVCEALAKLGKIPKKALEDIKKKARFNLERIKEIEERTQHDVAAFIDVLGRNLRDKARYLHFGLTSSDLLDTALAIQMRESAEILIEDTERLIALLAKKALKYKDMVCIGRTHGMHAEPITFGLKLALWYDEERRNLERLKSAKEIISVGKISGAVGTYAHLPPFVEVYVCKRLNLRPVDVSSQIISRDRHAHFLLNLAIVGASLEKFATEIRNLQRTEICEVEEPFLRTQKGSSAMPHKRNPVTCERICGLARILRSNTLSSLENISLWHERDISHSSVERVIIPDTTIILDYILNKFIQILEGLVVYPENMLANLIKTKGLIFSQRILLELMQKGLARSPAYRIVQRLAFSAIEEGIEFKDALLKDREIQKFLSREEIESCFDLDYYLKNIDLIFKRLGLLK